MTQLKRITKIKNLLVLNKYKRGITGHADEKLLCLDESLLVRAFAAGRVLVTRIVNPCGKGIQDS